MNAGLSVGRKQTDKNKFVQIRFICSIRVPLDKNAMKSLHIKHLHVAVDKKEILHGIDLQVRPGGIHVIMGPNGSGKSTLANTLAGHPKYKTTSGTIGIDREDITELTPDKRAKAGLFLSMQYPKAVEGVTIANMLRLAKRAQTGEQISPLAFHKELLKELNTLDIDPDFLKRYLNVDFSGGEKKKFEILQLLTLDPVYAILDETDSGLDVDALKIVADGINRFHSKEKGILLITHYNRILEYVKPDYVHIMVDGNIVTSGGAELAGRIEKEGYQSFV